MATTLDISWLLRASIVFSISALDAYFHDKVKFRAGHSDLNDMPPAMADFEIPLRELISWEDAKRKGNVFRNWFSNYFATRPLQRKEDIASALKIVGINELWATIEPDTPKRNVFLDQFSSYVTRRNQIAHEGDRLAHRNSAKKLRPINEKYVQDCIKFSRDLVQKIEKAFPK